MTCYLQNLAPGTRFRVADMTATLLGCSEASAKVRIDGNTTTWAPATVVEPIFNLEDNAMTTKTKKKTKTRAAKLSALDAAAQVLAKATEPMNAKQLIDAMAAKKLWRSPGGKTPHATLYSAILREINAMGKEARFKKTDRGRFASNE